MPTPLDEPALLRDTVALRFALIALIQALSDRGAVTGAEVVARLDTLIGGLPHSSDMDHGMHEALALIRSNLEKL